MHKILPDYLKKKFIQAKQYSTKIKMLETD